MTMQEPPSQAPATPAEALERRATIRLIRYWHALRRSERGCHFRDFNPYRNPIPWENCFLVRIASPEGTSHFEHIGRGIIATFFGGLSASRPVAASEIVAQRFGDLAAALAAGEVVKREGSFRRADGAVIRYRSVLLPFIGGQHEGYLLGALTHCLEAAGAGAREELRATA